MKTVTFTCDRCGGEGGPHEDYEVWDRVRRVKSFFKPKPIDLCPPCAAAFAEWLTELKPKEEPNDLPF